MAAVMEDFDCQQTREWLDALEALIEAEGTEGAPARSADRQGAPARVDEPASAVVCVKLRE